MQISHLMYTVSTIMSSTTIPLAIVIVNSHITKPIWTPKNSYLNYFIHLAFNSNTLDSITLGSQTRRSNAKTYCHTRSSNYWAGCDLLYWYHTYYLRPHYHPDGIKINLSLYNIRIFFNSLIFIIIQVHLLINK